VLIDKQFYNILAQSELKLDKLDSNGARFNKMAKLCLDDLYSTDLFATAELFNANKSNLQIIASLPDSPPENSEESLIISSDEIHQYLLLDIHRVDPDFDIFFISEETESMETITSIINVPGRLLIPVYDNDALVLLFSFQTTTQSINLDKTFLTCITNYCSRMGLYKRLRNFSSESPITQYENANSSDQGEELLSFFTNNKQLPVICFGSDGIIGLFNQGAQRLSGFTSDIVLKNTHILDLIDDRQGELLKIIETGNDFSSSGFRCKLLLVDGSSIPVDLYVYNISLEDAGKSQFLCLLLDKSDKRELEKQQSFLNAAINSSLDGFCLVDRMFNITMLNGAFAKLFSVNKDELSSKNLFEFHSDKFTDEQKHNLIQQLKSSGTWSGIITSVDEFDNNLLFEISISAVSRSTSTLSPVGFLIISRDVTDFENQQEKIRALVLQTKAFGEMALPAIAAVELKTHFRHFTQTIEKVSSFESAYIITFNDDEPWYNVYSGGYTDEHSLPYSLDKPILPPELIVRVRQGLMLGEHTFSLDSTGEITENWKPDNLVFISLTDYIGKIVGFLCVTNSRFTQAPSAEELLSLEVFGSQLSILFGVKYLQNQIEIQQIETQDFVYSVSHDLKSPLMSIIGFSNILKESLGEDLTSDQSHYLARISANINTIDIMVKDLLELARAGKISHDMENIDFREVIEKIAIDIENSNKINLDIEFDGDFENIFYDLKGITTVFTNLITNAYKFRDQKVPLKIAIGIHEENSDFLLYIRDNGIGIDNKHLPSIYDPFSRFCDKSIEGTGMGLTIVKKAIETRGGKIWVEQNQGGGSTFFFTIPIR